MNTKKLLGLALSGAMAFSMMAPAMAVTVNDLAEGAEVEVTGTTQLPTIEVEVPANAAIILNPYGIQADIPDAFGTGLTDTDQIISPVYAIENKSGIGIKVSGTVTGTIEGAEFATSTAVAETDKKVFLQIGFDAGASASAQPSSKVTVATTATNLAEVTVDKAGGTNAFATFQFSGDASKNPTTTWVEDDTVGAALAFTFTPNAATS